MKAKIIYTTGILIIMILLALSTISVDTKLIVSAIYTITLAIIWFK